MRNNPQHFSAYRAKDYRLPRSMREAYGYDPVLYEYEEKKFELPPVVIGVLVVAWLSAMYMVGLYVARSL